MKGLGNIAVMGGGPAGLYFSILAARNFPGSRIDVYEQNPDNVTFGFGIILAEGGYGRFHQADPQSADLLSSLSYVTNDRTIYVNDVEIQVEGGPVGYAIARRKLLQGMQQLAAEAGVNLHHGVRIENPDRLGADIIIGADGVNSVVRKSYDGEFGTSSWTLSNRMAWYGTMRYFPSPILSFKRTKFGHFWTAAYPHQADMSTFVAECDAEAWVRSGLFQMEEEERRLFTQEVFAEELQGHPLLSNKSNWGCMTLTRTKRWSYRNKVLLGDALRSPHPSIGSGTRIAMEDAVALIDSLKLFPGKPEQAFEDFEERHSGQSAKLVEAMERSAIWYESAPALMDSIDPIDFVFEFMTRTGRLSEKRLWAEYPVFMEKNRRHWRRWLGGRSQ